MLEYQSRDDFILADVRRFHSEQADYGCHWRDGVTDWPKWRVSYIRATGEVAAFEEGTGKWARVRVLGEIEPDDEATGIWYRALDAILGDYADPAVNGGFSLAWVEEKFAVRCRHCGHAITRTPPPNSTWVDRNWFPACVKARDLWDKPLWHEPMTRREEAR